MLKTKHGGDHYMLLDASEILSAAQSNPKWMEFQTDLQSTLTLQQFLHRASQGDEGYVQQSEKFLAEIEDQVPVSRGWRNVDDVVGAVPNVPAFLAGHPQHMRRRERTMKESAPLTIFMNLSSSMGIPHSQILKRGIVLLALVRTLVEHRSVELWVGTGLRTGSVNGVCAWKIDTQPMDLARAAFHVADSSMSRLFGYAMCESMPNIHLTSNADMDRCLPVLKRIAGWDDLLYIPPIHLYDPMVTNPVGWLKRELAKHVTHPEQEDAA